MTDGISARRAAALRSLALRPTDAMPPPRFPGETQPSDGLPDDPGAALRIFEARHRGLPTPEDPTR